MSVIKAQSWKIPFRQISDNTMPITGMSGSEVLYYELPANAGVEVYVPDTLIHSTNTTNPNTQIRSFTITDANLISKITPTSYAVVDPRHAHRDNIGSPNAQHLPVFLPDNDIVNIDKVIGLSFYTLLVGTDTVSLHTLAQNPDTDAVYWDAGITHATTLTLGTSSGGTDTTHNIHAVGCYPLVNYPLPGEPVTGNTNHPTQLNHIPYVGDAGNPGEYFFVIPEQLSSSCPSPTRYFKVPISTTVQAGSLLFVASYHVDFTELEAYTGPCDEGSYLLLINEYDGTMVTSTTASSNEHELMCIVYRMTNSVWVKETRTPFMSQSDLQDYIDAHTLAPTTETALNLKHRSQTYDVIPSYSSTGHVVPEMMVHPYHIVPSRELDIVDAVIDLTIETTLLAVSGTQLQFSLSQRYVTNHETETPNVVTITTPSNTQSLYKNQSKIGITFICCSGTWTDNLRQGEPDAIAIGVGEDAIHFAAYQEVNDTYEWVVIGECTSVVDLNTIDLTGVTTPDYVFAADNSDAHLLESRVPTYPSPNGHVFNDTFNTAIYEGDTADNTVYYQVDETQHADADINRAQLFLSDVTEDSYISMPFDFTGNSNPDYFVTFTAEALVTAPTLLISIVPTQMTTPEDFSIAPNDVISVSLSDLTGYPALILDGNGSQRGVVNGVSNNTIRPFQGNQPIRVKISRLSTGEVSVSLTVNGIDMVSLDANNLPDYIEEGNIIVSMSSDTQYDYAQMLNLQGLGYGYTENANINTAFSLATFSHRSVDGVILGTPKDAITITNVSIGGMWIPGACFSGDKNSTVSKRFTTSLKSDFMFFILALAQGARINIYPPGVTYSGTSALNDDTLQIDFDVIDDTTITAHLAYKTEFHDITNTLSLSYIEDSSVLPNLLGTTLQSVTSNALVINDYCHRLTISNTPGTTRDAGHVTRVGSGSTLLQLHSGGSYHYGTYHQYGLQVLISGFSTAEATLLQSANLVYYTTLGDTGSSAQLPNPDANTLAVVRDGLDFTIFVSDNPSGVYQWLELNLTVAVEHTSLMFDPVDTSAVASCAGILQGRNYGLTVQNEDPTTSTGNVEANTIYHTYVGDTHQLYIATGLVDGDGTSLTYNIYTCTDETILATAFDGVINLYHSEDAVVTEGRYDIRVVIEDSGVVVRLVENEGSVTTRTATLTLAGVTGDLLTSDIANTTLPEATTGNRLLMRIGNAELFSRNGVLSEPAIITYQYTGSELSLHVPVSFLHGVDSIHQVKFVLPLSVVTEADLEEVERMCLDGESVTGDSNQLLPASGGSYALVRKSRHSATLYRRTTSLPGTWEEIAVLMVSTTTDVYASPLTSYLPSLTLNCTGESQSEFECDLGNFPVQVSTLGNIDLTTPNWVIPDAQSAISGQTVTLNASSSVALDIDPEPTAGYAQVRFTRKPRGTFHPAVQGELTSLSNFAVSFSGDQASTLTDGPLGIPSSGASTIAFNFHHTVDHGVVVKNMATGDTIQLLEVSPLNAYVFDVEGETIITGENELRLSVYDDDGTIGVLVSGEGHHYRNSEKTTIPYFTVKSVGFALDSQLTVSATETLLNVSVAHGDTELTCLPNKIEVVDTDIPASACIDTPIYSSSENLICYANQITQIETSHPDSETYAIVYLVNPATEDIAVTLYSGTSVDSLTIQEQNLTVGAGETVVLKNLKLAQNHHLFLTSSLSLTVRTYRLSEAI